MNPQEKAHRREAFRAMSPGQKAGYLWDYYKWPILLGLLALMILCSTAHRLLTRRNTALYVALVNVAVGEDLENSLTGGFLAHVGLDEKRNQVYLYADLYLSDDPAPQYHEYAYASRLKLLAAVNAKQLDTALMNRESYDLLSRSGYLLDLTGLVPPGVEDCLTANTVILEDNATQVRLNEEQEYRAVSETVPNALDLSSLPLFRQAGFSQPVYLGVIANTPRQEEARQYLAYLLAP